MKSSGRRAIPVAQGKIVKRNSKSERYEALSPEGKKITDAVEVAVNTVTDRIVERATNKLFEVLNKRKRDK